MSYPTEGSFQLATAEYAYAVVPNDVTANGVPFRALYVGVSGNVTIVDLGGNVITFVGALAGTQIPCGGKRVMATNTTATSIVALV